ncbi:hypothetical protein O7598_27800 [Micromonospora sp. WMMC241]|uniref:hypothetical protein n=1 Tax=Micromonospora sp. WMMC241 TaxID=3015159 RepID=UPI0022B6F556|nr:hypothetical protein [Micromonospora sp. WMMC241]MCZ7440232.1 hypothetical protein [Micromonospora sp. WMMC241]
MTTSLDRRLAAVLALPLALTLAGCADREAGPQEGTDVPASERPAEPTAAATPEPATTPPTPAAPTPAASSGRPPLSATDLPTLRPPTGPPRHPTDQMKPNVLAGRISHGGGGPCYTLVTDDGQEHGLYGRDKGTWPAGTWVRVTVGPAPEGVECGPGRPLGLLRIERVA